MALLAPSVLAADHGRLSHCADAALEGGATWLHLDIMDGHFVPNLTFGPGVAASLATRCAAHDALLDVHLMVERPGRHVEAFAEAGVDLITVHAEATPHLHRVLQQLRDAEVRAGVALNPATPLGAIEEVLPMLDLVLIMSVNPGFGGQAFIPATLDKLHRLRQMLDAQGTAARVEVDGGVGPDNAAKVARAGADVLVAGSAVFGSGTVVENMEAIRQAIEPVA